MKNLIDLASLAHVIAASMLALYGTAQAQTLAPLITPYVNESDMASILQVFNSHPASNAAYGSLGYLHDGLDISPKGNLKPFRAACSGRVRWVLTFDDGVNVMIDCDSTYALEYNFETQAAQTGQTQLANIAVVEGQAVAQGDVIGSLYLANPMAHVHFAVFKDWVASCAEPYFAASAKNSIQNLVAVTFPGAAMCQGGDVSSVPLVTPYVNESDMASINTAFSADGSVSPWGLAHDGIDIFPKGDLKPFRAACSGVVSSVQLQRNATTANWQVGLRIDCNPHVPNTDGYFYALTLAYVFEPTSTVQAAGQTQLDNIRVTQGQSVSQNDIVGYLHTAAAGAHLHFGAIPFGALSANGVPSIPVCPEPQFSLQAKTSVLTLLRLVWPGASICYPLVPSAAAVLNLLPSWNMVGNSSESALTVASTFGDAAKVSTVWKWMPTTSRWAFYSPMLSDGGQAYAASNGYDRLTVINAGEGFWINAKAAFTATLPAATAVQSSSFRPAVAPAAGGTRALPHGWSLIAAGDSPTPSQFDAAIASASSPPPAAGQTYANLTSLWAWDAAQQKWYFWAPSLANSGDLANHLASKGYLDMGNMPSSPTGTLSPANGFWVNMP